MPVHLLIMHDLERVLEERAIWTHLNAALSNAVEDRSNHLHSLLPTDRTQLQAARMKLPLSLVPPNVGRSALLSELVEDFFRDVRKGRSVSCNKWLQQFLNVVVFVTISLRAYDSSTDACGIRCFRGVVDAHDHNISTRRIIFGYMATRF